MSKPLYLAGLVVVVALAAAGVFFGTDLLNPSGQSRVEATPQVATGNSGTSVEMYEQLVNFMNKSADGGGYAAGFSEQDVSKWQVAEGHQLERFAVGGRVVFARLSSGSALDEASTSWTPQGLSTTLPMEFATFSNGKKIEIGLIARSAQTSGSSTLMAVYATQQAGNSGWQKIALKSDFSVHRFQFDVPPVEAGYSNPPILVIHSNGSADGSAVEIIGVYVKLVQ
jgi:hypothetical protein